MTQRATHLLCALLFLTLLGSGGPSDAHAQGFDRDWEFSTADGNLPAYIGTSNDARSIAYGAVDDGSGGTQEVVLVGTGGSTLPYQVKVLDAADGSDLGTLPGVGTFPTPSDGRTLTDVEVTDDGIILACNEVNNSFTATTTTENFKCWRWNSLTDSPTLVIDYTPPDNGGDSQGDWVGRLVTAVGSAADNSLTIMTAAVRNSSAVYRFTTSDQGQSFTAEEISRDDRPPSGNINGVTPTGTGAAPFIFSPLDQAPLLYDSNGSEQAVDQGAFPSFAHSVKYFEVDGRTWVATFRWDSSGENQFAALVETTLGFASALPYAQTPSFGRQNPEANINGTGDVAVRVNGDNTATLYVLATNNGVGAYTTTTGLPVEMGPFQAQRSGGSAVLTWTTLSETNNSEFRIERSVNGAAFEAVGIRAGRGTTVEQTSYTFRDDAVPFVASTLEYRLRQVDVDGTDEISASTTLRWTPDGMHLLGSAPNPVAQQGTVRFTLAEQTDVRLAVYDVLGREVAVLADGVHDARGHEVPFDASRLASGTYFIRLQADGRTISTPMTVVR